MTTGYNAGLDSSDVVVSYAKEATWGTMPAVQFQAVRLTGEGFSEKKSRSRPAEIRATGDAAHAVTTQVEASGSLNFALSAGTYDGFLESLLNGTFTDVTVTGAAADTAAVAGTNKFTAGASKFTAVIVGTWIKTSGFATQANNGFHRVIAKAGNGADITVSSQSVLVNETPTGTNFLLKSSYMRNGVAITSLWVQKKFAAALFLEYAGSYVTSATITAQVGDFITGSFNFLVKSEAKAITEQSTGAVLDPPSGRVIDTVTGFSNLTTDDTAIAGISQGLELTVTKENAHSQFGIGSAAAVGMTRGTLMLSGKLTMYFANFTLYDLYKAETDKRITFRALDDQSKGYIFTLPTCTIMNPAVVAGGPDTDVLAAFELEGNPAPSSDTVYSGITIQIDRFIT